MPFLPGDLVHVASLGKGIVREARNGDRYLVDLNGRSLVATGGQLTRQEAPRKRAPAGTAPSKRTPEEYAGSKSAPAKLDLHGHTVAEALEAVSEFLNRQMLAGTHEVHIVHGRSGGRIKSALHAQLKGLPSIRSFRLDPRNAGVTIVEL
ncbi:MAG: Smr/MutS family protein [Thermoanaerobaculia bacterium]